MRSRFPKGPREDSGLARVMYAQAKKLTGTKRG